jgi:hypothetical protein
MTRDLAREIALSRPSSWWVGATVACLLALAIAGNDAYAGAAALTVAILAQLGVWWVRASRSIRRGMRLGDTLTVSYSDRELVVVDWTGEVRLPRGSVMLARRTGHNVTIYGRSVSFVLPGELLTAEDVAFLEGYAGPAEPGPQEAPPPALPLRVQVTDTIQHQLVAAATRWTVTTADFLVPLVAAGSVGALAVVTRVWGFLWVAGFLLALALPGSFQIAKLRAALREVYPVGRTIAARVTPEELTLTLRHGSQTTPWGAFEAVKGTESVVLLRFRRRRFGTARILVLPLALFRAEDVRTMAKAVPGRF